MYPEKFFWKVYVFRTSATWLLWTYGGWLLGGCPSWSQCNCQCVYLEWTRYILHNFEWNKYQHPLLSYHFSSLYNLIGVASFEELSKTCCHLQEHIKWQKIDSRWCLCWSHIHQQCQSQPTCKKNSPFWAAFMARLGNSCLLTGLDLWSWCWLDIGAECLPALLLRRGWRLCL